MYACRYTQPVLTIDKLLFITTLLFAALDSGTGQLDRYNSLMNRVCIRTIHQSAKRMMKGINIKEFGGPEVLKIDTQIPIPKAGANQLLVKVEAAGVNPVDTYIRTGTHTIKPKLPYIPGSDAAGTVHELGAGVTNFKKGDRVYIARSVSGSYAEYAQADDYVTFPLESSLSFEQGASIGVPYCTAYRALVTRGKAKSGETVLVHGASGAVGLAACQIAKALGLDVIGTAGTKEGMDAVIANGATACFNHRTDDIIKNVMDYTKGKGVNLLLEMLANVNLDKDLQIMAFHGRIAIIGNRGTVEINPRYTMTKELTVLGIMLGHNTKEDWAEMGSFMHEGQKKGWLKPVVGKTYPLENTADAHKEVIEHSAGTKGKIVLKI